MITLRLIQDNGQIDTRLNRVSGGPNAPVGTGRFPLGMATMDEVALLTQTYGRQFSRQHFGSRGLFQDLITPRHNALPEAAFRIIPLQRVGSMSNRSFGYDTNGGAVRPYL